MSDRKRIEWAILLLLFAAALALRLVRLGHEPLWFDEAYTALQAAQSPGRILDLLRGEAGAPLYYLLLSGWTRLFGDGEVALRMISALAGAAATPTLYAAGSALFSRRAGWIAAAVGLVSPLHLHYSQEARMYAVVALVALVALWTLHRLLTRPSIPAAVAFGLLLAAGLYLHYYFVFLLPLAALAFLGADRRRSVGLSAGALALAAAVFAPWLPTLLHQTNNRSTEWIADYWSGHALALAVPWSVECLGPGALYPGWVTLKLGSSLAAGVLSLLLAAAVVAGAVLELRRTDARSQPAWAAALAGLGLPLVLAWLWSLAREPVYVVARYDLIAWGPYCLLVGAVLSRLRSAVAFPLLALWLGMSIATLVPAWTTDRPMRNYAERGPQYAEQLRSDARPGETVVFTAGTRTTTEYYLGERAGELRLVSFPPANDEHLGWVATGVHRNDALADEAAQELIAAVIDPAPPDALWIVAPESRGTPRLLRALAARGYAPDERRTSKSLLCLARSAGR